MDWVYLHEVLSKFSLSHWMQEPLRGSHCRESFGCKQVKVLSNQRRDDNPVDLFGEILESIWSICDIALPSTERRSDDNKQRITEINAQAGKLRNLKVFTSEDSTSILNEQNQRTARTIELHRLAALIYVNRAVTQFSGQENQHRLLVMEGLSLLGKTGICEPPWPLFIIACEARTDLERRAVLKLFLGPQSEEQKQPDRIVWIRRMVEASWNQDDLHADDEDLDYLTKIKAVINASSFLPIFA